MVALTEPPWLELLPVALPGFGDGGASGMIISISSDAVGVLLFDDVPLSAGGAGLDPPPLLSRMLDELPLVEDWVCWPGEGGETGTGDGTIVIGSTALREPAWARMEAEPGVWAAV